MKKTFRSLSKPSERGHSKYEQSDETFEESSHQTVSDSDECKEEKRKTVSDNSIFARKECKLGRTKSVNILLRTAVTLKDKIIRKARTPPPEVEPTISEDAKNLHTALADLIGMPVVYGKSPLMMQTSPPVLVGDDPTSKLSNSNERKEHTPPISCMDGLTVGDLNGFQNVDNKFDIQPDMKYTSEKGLATDPVRNDLNDTIEQCKNGENVNTKSGSMLVETSAVCSDLHVVPNASTLSEEPTKVGDTEAGNTLEYANAGETEELDEKVAGAIKNRQYVIRELIETEKDYVRDMKEIVDGYLEVIRDPNSEIALPDDLRGGKIKIVFGNIENIYEWHRDIFSKALEQCMDHSENVGPLFKKYERKLTMYVVYCQNKPMSEHIVTEYIDSYFEEIRRKLGHALTICDFLIKPVQRIMKYQLLLRDMLKYTEIIGSETEIENLKQATHIMHVVPKEANDMMNVGRLQGFDGKITAQGKLLLFGPLLCTEGTSAVNLKGKEHQVFLFKHSIIFSEPVGKKTQFANAGYIYKAHMLANQLNVTGIVDDGDACKFILRSTDPRKPVSFVCQAASRESRDEWITQLKLILQTQNDFIQAIQSPIQYHKNKLANL